MTKEELEQLVDEQEEEIRDLMTVKAKQHNCIVELEVKSKKEILMEWTKDRPTVAGLYIYKADGQWPLYLKRIHSGRWQDGKNPEWLYADDTPIHQMTSGLWYGPIPEARLTPNSN